ncbi:MAG: bifunctional glycosyltransferase family 2/GtrA family protein [Eubacterium sp.]|nr:bifunctional glycosyltransferase family 2/GtrA family protein [Eubacterium sp.]
MGDFKKDMAIVIPALNPDDKMVTTVKSLKETGFENIILVDDGSEISNRVYFRTCKEEYGCKIIRHVVNFGKGIALKSAFNYILTECPDIAGAVTCDCDGQHLTKDIEKCAALTYENPDSLVLGCRQFDDKTIPFRSRFGNKFTKVTLMLLAGLKVSDTQTGLRGIPVKLLKEHFANTKGERFEYEMNELLEARDYHITIVEFPIETVYIEENKSSHFNPFRDSIRIYKVFIKFILSSFSSFLIDILIYWLSGYFFRLFIPDEAVVYGVSAIILSRTVFSRLISSIYNFMINKTKVFKNRSSSPMVVVKYYTLAIVQLVLSAVLVNYAFLFIPYSTVRKVIVDTLLFVVSYLIQREWVFKHK